MKSFILTFIKFITKSLELISSPLAGAWASRMFFFPHTRHTKTLELENMQTNWLELNSSFGGSHRCKVYQAGQGPTILLIHGWEGSAYSYTVLSQRLVDSGYKVILVDFPAHGQSSGKKTNLEELQRLIRHLSEQEKNLHAIIGHSFGAFATAYAISLKLNVKQFISISSPVDMNFIVDSLCETIGATEKTKQRLITKIESILKAPYEFASMDKNSMINELSGLIIHDQNDKKVPYHQAEKLAKVWPKARLISTSGLGHSRILRDDHVINKIIGFLKTANQKSDLAC